MDVFSKIIPSGNEMMLKLKLPPSEDHIFQMAYINFQEIIFYDVWVQFKVASDVPYP